MQVLSSSISFGAGFETHNYQSFLWGRGLLFADQQLMANEKSVRLVRLMLQMLDYLLNGLCLANDEDVRTQSTYWISRSGLTELLLALGQFLSDSLDHNELLRSLFFHINFSYVLCFIVDAMTSTFIAYANLSLYIKAMTSLVMVTMMKQLVKTACKCVLVVEFIRNLEF